jgi:dynein heavy chain
MPEGDTSYILLIVISIYYRNRVRMFPAIVNCTTIDWYSEWPQDALLEVAEKYIQEVSLGSDTNANT